MEKLEIPADRFILLRYIKLNPQTLKIEENVIYVRFAKTRRKLNEYIKACW